MRVVNDKQETTETKVLDPLSLVTHSILTAFGVLSVVFSPLPMIVAAVRLPEPWSKVAAILGAILALLFFNVEPAVVVMTFVFGLFVADGVSRDVKFWPMLGQAGSVATLVSFVALLICAQWDGVTPLQFWLLLCDGFMTQLQSAIKLQDPLQWDFLRSTLVHEGPFLLLSSVFLSFWLSLGLAAHLGLMKPGSPYSSEGLRQIRLPMWSSGIFLALFILVNILSEKGFHWLLGLYRVSASLMFIAGSVCISQVLARKGTSPRLRTVIYSSLMVLGFPIVVGVGVLGPWFLRKSAVRLNERLEEVI